MPDAVPSTEEIPGTLLEYDQWICWLEKERDGKPTKVPTNAATGEFASTTDRGTWASFLTARTRAESGGGRGIGFVFTNDDPFVGVDLDDCRIPETGTTADWAEDIMDQLDSYTEISPSGTGFHVLLKGALPEGRNRKGDVECYETARFFTFTGNHVEGTPTEIRERSAELHAIHEEYVAERTGDRSTTPTGSATASGDLGDEELLRRAKSAANGEKFERLWRGSIAGYESHSEADMALCSLLAFWTGGDVTQMDRIFRVSGLMREKWDERNYADGSTYGEMTIDRAIAGTSEFYERPDPDATAAASDVGTAVEQDFDPVYVREEELLQRVAELERQLNQIIEEKETLEADIEIERERRRDLEPELKACRENGRSLFSWR